MSSDAAQSDLVTDVVTIRVETTETGWPLSQQTWASLERLSWLHLQSDGRGLRGVLARSADGPDPVEILSPLTRELAELGTVEVRDDVVLMVAPQPVQTVSQLRKRLGDAEIEPLGLLVADGRPAAVLDGWRADAARDAVR